MSYHFPQEKPLLNYSDTLERATLVDYDDNDDDDSMPRIAKRRRKSRQKRGRKIKTTKGRISLKIKGYSGKTSFSAAQLLPFIPLNKIKIAAKKVLRRTVAGKSKKIKRRKRKSRK